MELLHDIHCFAIPKESDTKTRINSIQPIANTTKRHTILENAKDLKHQQTPKHPA
jgi:hypothetical protein